MGALNVSEIIFSTQNNLYIWGFYAYFHPKMQIFANVCVTTWKIHSQSNNDKISILEIFLWLYIIVSDHDRVI